MKKSHLFGAVCALTLIFSFAASASSINVDFGRVADEPASSYGGIGEAGTWNQSLTGTTSNLIDTNGTITDVSVLVTAGNNDGATTGPFPNDIDKLLGDNVFTPALDGGLWEAQFNGLSDGNYKVILYAPSNTLVSTGIMTINGIAAGELTGADPISMISGVSYEIYQTVVSGGLLTIAGTTTGSEFDFSGIAGVQLVMQPLPVTIDIKPDSNINPINPGSKGKLTVAILTTEDFDASMVDASIVQFGPSAAAPIRYRLDDVDDDGDWDLALKFNTQETGISCGDTEATLIGETFDGQSFTGTDFIRTVGCK